VEVCPFEAIKMDVRYDYPTENRFAALQFDKHQLSKSNEYYHQIHPTEASAVDAALAAAKHVVVIDHLESETVQKAGLVLPAGAQGPAFLTLRNFDAIYAYNASINYTLAIALLSDRLRSQPGLVAAWPTDDPGTSRAERREIQQLLLARGYDIGTVDGMVGDKTRQAIQEEQRRRGLPVDDGRPGQRILKALRQSP